MGAVRGKTCWELLVMLTLVLTVGLACLAAGQLLDGPAAVPLTPGNIPGLVPGSAASAQWWTAQLIHRGQLAHHVSKRQAATPVTPGNIPGLVPGSAAAAQWWTAQLIHQQQLAHH